MKREIKYRGKRIDNGEWAFGFYVADVEWANYYIYFPEHSGVFIKMKQALVDPKTVGQFTGLTDENENSSCVYEGDIVSLEGKIIGNIYENEALLKDPTNLVIKGLGTKTWAATEIQGLERGLKYSE